MAGIYLHIPFCQRRCIYCDFYSTTAEDKKEEYLDALCHELSLRRDYLQGQSVRSIYLGGGTPSQLNETQLKRLLDTIYYIYKVEPDAEITLEANPDDLNTEYIAALRHLPFNRISIGIQTFDDATLTLLQRRHTARQAIEAVRHCQTEGFDNISIDLIYGLPGQTISMWEADLQQALELDVQHISAYHLTYEEGTPLWKLRAAHQVCETDEDTSLLFFSCLIDRLQNAGFEHYEISNFARPGRRSRHNSGYWTGELYLGCGPSAHSYNGTSRQWNVASLPAYLTSITQGQLDYETEVLDLPTRYNDRVVTAVRTCEGLSLIQLRQEFGQDLYDYCLNNARPHLRRGTLIIENEHLRLTRKGIFVSDGIMSDLLWVEEEI